MPDRPAPKRIKSMDELLMAVEPESQPTNIKSGVVRLKFSQVDPYPNHPFRLYSGERLDDMIESISNYGILTPMIARTKASTLPLPSPTLPKRSSRILKRCFPKMNSRWI